MSAPRSGGPPAAGLAPALLLLLLQTHTDTVRETSHTDTVRETSHAPGALGLGRGRSGAQWQDALGSCGAQGNAFRRVIVQTKLL